MAVVAPEHQDDRGQGFGQPFPKSAGFAAVTAGHCGAGMAAIQSFFVLILDGPDPKPPKARL